MRTRRLLAWTVLAVLLAVPSLRAQADVAGEWRVEFGTPSGPIGCTMYVSQAGSKLKGRLTNEIGEFPMTGEVDGDQVKIVWQMPDLGSMLDITFTARARGDKLDGTVRIEKVGEGPMSADRIGR